MTRVEVQRLTARERERAKRAFALMAQIFEEAHAEFPGDKLARLLGNEDFYCFVAKMDDQLVGVLTAHTLRRTATPAAEVFVYDIAVREDRRRQGVGRSLLGALCQAAADADISEVIVPVDASDSPALEFYRALGGAASSVEYFTFKCK